MKKSAVTFLMLIMFIITNLVGCGVGVGTETDEQQMAEAPAIKDIQSLAGKTFAWAIPAADDQSTLGMHGTLTFDQTSDPTSGTFTIKRSTDATAQLVTYRLDYKSLSLDQSLSSYGIMNQQLIPMARDSQDYYSVAVSLSVPNDVQSNMEMRWFMGQNAVAEAEAYAKSNDSHVPQLTENEVITLETFESDFNTARTFKSVGLTDGYLASINLQETSVIDENTGFLESGIRYSSNDPQFDTGHLIQAGVFNGALSLWDIGRFRKYAKNTADEYYVVLAYDVQRHCCPIAFKAAPAVGLV